MKENAKKQQDNKFSIDLEGDMVHIDIKVSVKPALELLKGTRKGGKK